MPEDDEVMVFEPTYKLEGKIYEEKVPQEGFQIALSMEEMDKEKER